MGEWAARQVADWNYTPLWAYAVKRTTAQIILD